MTTTFRHVLRQQGRFHGATPEFFRLFFGLTLAVKMTESQERCAGLKGITGTRGRFNAQGEVRQRLNVCAYESFANSLSLLDSLGVIGSEQDEAPPSQDGGAHDDAAGRSEASHGSDRQTRFGGWRSRGMNPRSLHD